MITIYLKTFICMSLYLLSIVVAMATLVLLTNIKLFSGGGSDDVVIS